MLSREEVLKYLKEHGPATAEEISQALGLSISTVRVYIHHARRAGYVVSAIKDGHRAYYSVGYTPIPTHKDIDRVYDELDAAILLSEKLFIELAAAEDELTRIKAERDRVPPGTFVAKELAERYETAQQQYAEKARAWRLSNSEVERKTNNVQRMMAHLELRKIFVGAEDGTDVVETVDDIVLDDDKT